MVISINRNKFRVKTVFLKKDTQNGMMRKKFDNTYNGMLFLMDNSENCFWMKNCIINLDIIFLNNGKITKIHHDCEPCNTEDCKNYCGNGDMILEVKGGTCKRLDINVGDKLEFKN
jgi:uncharacterized membrane protein (UPF0127 family)